MDSTEDSLFEKALAKYQSGVEAKSLLRDFEDITKDHPTHSAGWTCLAWLQLLCNRNEDALRSARIAVKLNSKDPQSRINLSLALLETKAKGVRDHIDFVKRALVVVPELEKELKNSIEDGLMRKPDWPALKKIQNWLFV